MDLYQILAAILDKPSVPKFYRELRNHYQSKGMMHESSAISHLIEHRFEKKDVITVDSPHGSQEQRSDGGTHS
jgi:hypothetical protein